MGPGEVGYRGGEDATGWGLRYHTLLVSAQVLPQEGNMLPGHMSLSACGSASFGEPEHLTLHSPVHGITPVTWVILKTWLMCITLVNQGVLVAHLGAMTPSGSTVHLLKGGGIPVCPHLS